MCWKSSSTSEEDEASLRAHQVGVGFFQWEDPPPPPAILPFPWEGSESSMNYDQELSANDAMTTLHVMKVMQVTTPQTKQWEKETLLAKPREERHPVVSQECMMPLKESVYACQEGMHLPHPSLITFLNLCNWCYSMQKVTGREWGNWGQAFPWKRRCSWKIQTWV